MKAKKTLLKSSFFVQVVDTSQLVKDKQDLLSTQKVVCIFKKGLLHNLASSSSKNSLLRKIYYEKSRLRPEMKMLRELYGDRCWVTLDRKIMQLVLANGIYVLGPKDVGNLLMSIGSLVKSFFTKVWLIEKIYEYNLVFYYNPDKPRIAWE